jgi:uncharacterized delta-60 repeat protein
VVTFTPDPGFSGEDSFNFTVSDGQSTSSPGTVSIGVHSVGLDPGFGTGGVSGSDFGGEYSESRAVVEQADGTLLVAGWARPDEVPGVLENASAVVAKLTRDGSLDPTFGVDGLATAPDSGRDNYFYDMVLQPDGKIVAVGSSKPDVILGGDPLVIRFEQDGSLDTGFGSGGVVMPDLDGRAVAVELQADGRILVGGGFFGSPFDPHDLGITRLMANGNTDMAFGTDGVVRIRNAGDDLVSGLAVQPDGAIVLAGTLDQSNTWGAQDIALVRLLPDGSLDTTFGNDGEATIDLGAADTGRAMALQEDGNILIVGDMLAPYDRDAVVVRATSTGALDTSFGGSGVTNVSFGGDFEQFNDLVVQADGSVLAVGSSGAEGEQDLIVARLLTDGSLDPTFDSGVTAPFDLGGDETALAVALESGGEVLLAGRQGAEWAVLRLVLGGTVPTGMLRVATDPAVPSQILLDGVPMDRWGLTWVKVPVGEYALAFTDVQGFSGPATQSVTVSEDTTTTVNGSFLERGWLQVTTSPAVPATIYVDGAPMDDWGVWTDVDPGSYEVCFGAVAGYAAPECQVVDVVAGTNTPVEGVFTSNPDAPGATGHGYLRVTTDPAVPAQILIDGLPRDSWGLNWVKLEPGSYEVAFTDVQGFTTPDSQVVSVTADSTSVVQGNYIERGWLQVTTDPPVPGTIYVDGIARNDWGLWTDLGVGLHEVCFGDSPGFTTPDCAPANLTADEQTAIVGSYTP